MKKLSRNLRKKMSASNQSAYNKGYLAGYAEGYFKGLHDGNPFNAIIDGIASIVESFNEVMKDNPELVAEVMEAQKDEGI